MSHNLIETLTQLNTLALEKSQFEKQTQELNQKLQQLDLSTQQTTSHSQDIHLTIFELEKSIKMHNKQCEESQYHMSQVRVKIEQVQKQRELEALYQELGVLQEHQDRIEKLLLKKLDLLSQLKKEVHQANKHQAEVNNHLEKQKETIKVELDNLIHAQKPLEQIIMQAASTLPVELVEQYRYAIRKNLHPAVSNVTPNNLCKACHTPIANSELAKIRKQTTGCCKNCFRVLFALPPETAKESTV